jgi:hypothetical protein
VGDIVADGFDVGGTVVGFIVAVNVAAELGAQDARTIISIDDMKMSLRNLIS